MEKINVHQAKTHFSAILEKAHNGEVVIIAKAGKPYARLMPLDTPPARTAGRYPMKSPTAFSMNFLNRNWMPGDEQIPSGYSLSPVVVVG
jgi:prevent-host-death family protein